MSEHLGVSIILDLIQVFAAWYGQEIVLEAVREYVARVRAVFDATLIRRQPHFTGPKIVPGVISGERCPAD